MKAAPVLITALLLAGCSKPETVVPEPIRGASAGNVSFTAELHQAVLQRGRAIAAEMFSLLSSNLQSALETGGVTNALPYCSLAASPLTASVGDRHGVTLRRVTHKPRNPTDRADAAESAILARYRNDLRVSNALMPMVTNLTAETLTFFAPIVLTNALCLKCHGKPGEDISTEHMEVIRRLYPRDEAVGFKLGELRGAWRIDFAAKALTELQPAASP